MSTRPLLLHASALNDEEYGAYTTSLRDLAWTDDEEDKSPRDDAFYENLQIGVRELRGWLRGRYSQVLPADLDTILKYFSATFTPNDMLSGAQVFAVLRLAVHVQAGKQPDRSLAFVQAHPKTSSKQAPPPPAPGSKPSSNPFVSRSKHNPFAAVSATTSLEPPSPGSLPSSPSRVPPLPPRKPSSVQPRIPSQPILPPPRHNSILLPNMQPAKSVSPSRLSSTAVGSGGPPPIPAKPTHVTSALMKQSLQASRAAQAIKKAEEQLEQERVLQVLKSSSVVSGGYSLAGASIERSSVVIGTNIRSTNPSTSTERGRLPHPRDNHQPSNSANSYRSDTRSVASTDAAEERPPPPLPRRRNTYHNHHPRQDPSPPPSVSSLQQVALATPPSFPGPSRYHAFGAPLNHLRSPETSPSRRAPPPPTHPDRKPPPLQPNFPPTPDSPFTDTKTTSETESSPTARVFRSKSLHHPSPHTLPPPVPPSLKKKRRPESMQVLSPGPSTFSETPFGDERSNPFHREGPPLPSPLRHNAQPPQHPGHRRASASLSVPTSAKSTPSTISEDSGDESRDRHPRHPLGTSSRHASFGGNTLSRNGENIAVSFQRTINNLHPRLEARLDALQPKLEKAKYKAEAGLNFKRGFVAADSGIGGLARKGSLGKRREEKEELLPGRDDRMADDDGRYDPPSVDESVDGDLGEDSDTEDARRQWAREARERWGANERDRLKWPVRDQPMAEGWTRMR